MYVPPGALVGGAVGYIVGAVGLALGASESGEFEVRDMGTGVQCTMTDYEL
jgi:hypothetical protein